MLGHPFLHSFRGLVLLYRAHSERVVADHGFLGQSHIGLRSAAAMILKRVLLEEAIERFLPTVECVDGMVRLKFFDAPGQRVLCLS